MDGWSITKFALERFAMIEFKVSGRGWEAKDVAQYVAAVIGGRKALLEPIFHDTERPKWQLDAGNDWFLSAVKDQPNTYSLRYRYTTATTQDALEGLKTFFEKEAFA